MRRLLFRAFSNALARRVAYVIVALFMAALGIGHARAAAWGVQTCPISANCNQGHASAACDSQVADFKAKNPTWTYIYAGCRLSGKQYDPVIDGRPPGGTRLSRTGLTEYFGALCTALPALTSTFAPKSGSISCSDGCEQVWYKNADGTSTGSYSSGLTCNTTDFPNKCGTGFYWNSVLSVCEPVKEDCLFPLKLNSLGKCAQEPCPDGMSMQQDGTCKAKENECPAGQVKGPDGSCIKKTDSCATGQALGADGTCKPDKDGDGKPDDEDTDDDGEDDKKSFSGGDSCASPPSCSGDPIMCGQARIQWRIDCNTRRSVNIAGGSCAAVPVCTGDKCDAMEYSQLLMQWRTACAVEKLKSGTDGPKGDANGNGVADVLEGTGTVSDPGNGASDVAGAKRFGIGISTDLIDKDNMFGGGSCPQPPTFKLMGQTISGADFPYFCQAAAILRALILLWGAYTALRILMGWGF